MTDRRREAVALALAILAALLTVLAIGGLYLREELARPAPFADRALAALDDPAVQDVVARRIVLGLERQGATNLVVARPVVEEAVRAIIGTPPFRRAARTTALESHQLLFERGRDTIVFSLADAGTIVLSAVRSMAPEVAQRIPAQADVVLAQTTERSFASGSLDRADRLRRSAVLAVVLAAVLTLAAVLLSRHRRRALGRYALGVGVWAVAAAVAVATVRGVVIGGVRPADTLTEDELRAAMGATWDAFFGDLYELLGVAAAAGFILAGAAKGALPAPSDLADRARRFWLRPKRTVAQTAEGAALVLVGAVAFLHPAPVAHGLVADGGAALVYVGFASLLDLVGPPAARPRGQPAGGRRQIATLVLIAAGTLGVASAAAALLIGSRADVPVAAAAPPTGCNGRQALCAKRLNEVVFPGTHNAMGAADSPGWLLPNQRHDVPRQLADGIRLFLLDTHYGRRRSGGSVSTDFEAEGTDYNKVAKQLSPEALAAYQRLGPTVGRTGGTPGPLQVFLCHTLCELGATEMPPVLDAMREQIRKDPGTVLMLIMENYVKESDLVASFRDAGLLDEVVTLDRDAPLPTLGELTAAGKHLVVFTERKPTGQYPFLNSAFSFIQDTPLGATRPDQLSCDRYRGDADSPILMLNHWIDRFPPPPRANREILTQTFVEDRMRRCARARGLPVSLIASDFYDEGPFVSTVDGFNGAP